MAVAADHDPREWPRWGRILFRVLACTQLAAFAAMAFIGLLLWANDLPFEHFDNWDEGGRWMIGFLILVMAIALAFAPEFLPLGWLAWRGKRDGPEWIMIFSILSRVVLTIVLLRVEAANPDEYDIGNAGMAWLYSLVLAVPWYLLLLVFAAGREFGGWDRPAGAKRRCCGD